MRGRCWPVNIVWPCQQGRAPARRAHTTVAAWACTSPAHQNTPVLRMGAGYLHGAPCLRVGCCTSLQGLLHVLILGREQCRRRLLEGGLPW